MSEKPSEDSLIAYYKQQFIEIYHLDTLDWRIALVLLPAFGAFFAVLGFLKSFGPPTQDLLIQGVKAFSWLSMLLAFYGMWTVARNQVWLGIRVKLIEEAEKAMKVDKIWSKVVEQTKFSLLTGRRIPLFLIYVFLLGISSSVAFASSIENWTFNLILSEWSIVMTVGLTIVCLIIQGIYWKKHRKKTQARRVKKRKS